MVEISKEKIKKYGLYGLAAIGALVVVIFLFQIFSGLFLRTGYYSGYDKGGVMAVGSTGFNFSLPDFFSGTPANLNQEARKAAPTPNPEGELTKRKVIKNATLSLLVKKAEESAKKIQEIAESLGGFVNDSQVYEVSEGTKAGTVIIRVPASRFGEALEGIRKLAIKVERENLNTQDITEQYIDLEARLKNLQAEEQQYLEIMKKAYSIKDTLEVASRLTDARGRIEQIQGQIQYLGRQVEMSTLTVSLTSESDIEVFGIRWQPLFKLKQEFRKMLTGLTDYIDAAIAFIFQLPVTVLWLATYFLFALAGWKVLVFLKTRFWKR